MALGATATAAAAKEAAAKAVTETAAAEEEGEMEEEAAAAMAVGETVRAAAAARERGTEPTEPVFGLHGASQPASWPARAWGFPLRSLSAASQLNSGALTICEQAHASSLAGQLRMRMPVCCQLLLPHGFRRTTQIMHD